MGACSCSLYACHSVYFIQILIQISLLLFLYVGELFINDIYIVVCIFFTQTILIICQIRVPIFLHGKRCWCYKVLILFINSSSSLQFNDTFRFEVCGHLPKYGVIIRFLGYLWSWSTLLISLVAVVARANAVDGEANK